MTSNPTSIKEDMTVEMDRTRRDIVLAFNSLISQMELDEITSLMIAETAMVSKSTFYRYFKDKYDVMNYNFKTLLDECVISSNNYHDMFFLIFQTLKKEWKPLRKAFNSTGTNSLENFIYNYSKQIAIEITRQNRDGQEPTHEECFQIDLVCFGISHMYKEWAIGAYNISPKVAADLLYEMIPASLKHR